MSKIKLESHLISSDTTHFFFNTNKSKTAQIYIVGEDDHFSKKNQDFKDRLMEIASTVTLKPTFILGLEGRYLESFFPECLDINNARLQGIEDPLVLKFAFFVRAYMYLNSNNSSELVDNRFCEIATGAFYELEQYIHIMPDLKVAYCKIERALDLDGKAISANREVVSNLFKSIISFLKNEIQNKIPNLIDHPAFSDEVLNTLFLYTHHFKHTENHFVENAQANDLMKLFLADLRNVHWKDNMMHINDYALNKGLSVIYIVGDGHIKGLKKLLGNHYGKFPIHYYASHNPETSCLKEFLEPVSIYKSHTLSKL